MTKYTFNNWYSINWSEISVRFAYVNIIANVFAIVSSYVSSWKLNRILHKLNQYKYNLENILDIESAIKTWFILIDSEVFVCLLQWFLSPKIYNIWKTFLRFLSCFGMVQVEPMALCFSIADTMISISGQI